MTRKHPQVDNLSRRCCSDCHMLQGAFTRNDLQEAPRKGSSRGRLPTNKGTFYTKGSAVTQGGAKNRMEGVLRSFSFQS